MANAKKTPSGRWRVNQYIGTFNGKRKYKSFTADTKKEAEFLASQFNLNHSDFIFSGLTLHDCIVKYIENKRNILSPATVRGYYVLINNYCLDLMPTLIDDLTQEMLQISFNKLASSYSSKTCRNIYGLISAALKIYRPDFTFNITLPKKTKRLIYVPDEAEIKHIFSLASGTFLEIPVFLASECGLRASEISGLKFENIFPTYIYISSAVVLGDDGNTHLKTPKSYSGFRKIPISSNAYNYLTSFSSDSDFLFPYPPYRICGEWCKFRKRNLLNKHLNFHALRHHYASKCLLLGIPQKYIAELMGHSSTDMIEQVYQHTFPSAMNSYSDLLRAQMDDLFNFLCNSNL